MNHRAATLSLGCIIAALAVPSVADTQHLRPGDRLTYDLTIALDQQQAFGKGSLRHPGAHDTTSGTGSETIDITSLNPDGTAAGTLAIDMLGFVRGQPMSLHKSVGVTVTQSGEIKPASGIDPLVDQTITFANLTVRDVAPRNLSVNASWHSQIQSDAYPMTIALTRLLRGQRQYQGLPTFIVQTTGSGKYSSTTDPLEASVNVAGTSYYDQRDGIFVGEAIRSDTTVLDNDSGESVDSSALITVVLRDFVRGPQVEVSPLPLPEPTESPEQEPAPAAVPTGYGATPLPTVTPSRYTQTK